MGFSRYVAYGLRLVSWFRLPGMGASENLDDELPSLLLLPKDLEEQESEWNDRPRRLAWRGRLGDGRELRIERSEHDETLYVYGDLARFILDPSMQTLHCVSRRAGHEWQQVLIGKVLPSIAVIRGYEALHAATIDSPSGVIAIMGASGAGKSTLAFEMMSRGHPLFADDQLTLERIDDFVRAHPGTPHMNISVTTDSSCLSETLASSDREHWVTASSISSRPRPVHMLCLLERRAGAGLEVQTLPANPLQLAPYMLGLTGSVERERARFCLFADLTTNAKIVRLSGGTQHTVEQFGDLLADVAGRPSERVA